MKDTLIKILKIVIPIGIGVYLTWYFFSNMSDQELEDTKTAFKEANYFWVALSLIVAFLSHLSRAYRWLFLLEPMGYKPSLKNAYHAVMSGYIINLTVPRSGEVARAGLLANYEKVPFEKGFGTIVVERVFDVLMLGLVVLISGLLQANDLSTITSQGVQKSESNWLIYALIICGILGVIGLVAYLKIPSLKEKVNSMLKGLWEGLTTVWTMKKKWAFLFHTIFIWTCYISMMWICALAFPETASMPIGCVFASFVVGAAAIAAVPGGLGLYPLWVTLVLESYNIGFEAGFSIFMWVVQTILIVVLGLLSLFLIQRQPKLLTTDGES